MIGINAINDANIAAACAMDDIDDACAHLQNIAGIHDGGIAGICFSSFDWQSAEYVDREYMIHQWLDTERAYSEG